MMDGHDIRTITLLLTNDCNLHCSYCYEKHKKKHFMSLEKAKDLIDSELSNAGDTYFVIDLFGGEPFLCFETIKEIVAYVEMKYSTSNVQFTISTNGTLVHGEIQEWILNHSQRVRVGLSFDGTEEMQNCNRSNSFDQIDLSFFASYLKDQKIKMTISPQTLNRLSDGVIFLHSLGFGVACNLAFDIDWKNPDYQHVLSTELAKLIEYYLNHPNIEPCTMLSFNLCSLDGTIPTEFKKWCGSGTHMVAYDTDGSCYPCHFFLPVSIGDDKASAMKGVRLPDLIDPMDVDEKCRNCKLFRVCPTCIGSNFDETAKLFSKSESYCSLMKIIIAANSYFCAYRIEKGQLHISDYEKRLLMRGILTVQDCMRD